MNARPSLGSNTWPDQRQTSLPEFGKRTRAQASSAPKFAGVSEPLTHAMVAATHDEHCSLSLAVPPVPHVLVRVLHVPSQIRLGRGAFQRDHVATVRRPVSCASR